MSAALNNATPPIQTHQSYNNYSHYILHVGGGGRTDDIMTIERDNKSRWQGATIADTKAIIVHLCFKILT